MLQESVRKKRAGEGGFTLIELLIVIVILGILAAIVVFAVGGITDRGNTVGVQVGREDRRGGRRGVLRPERLLHRHPRAGHREAAQARHRDRQRLHHLGELGYRRRVVEHGVAKRTPDPVGPGLAAPGRGDDRGSNAQEQRWRLHAHRAHDRDRRPRPGRRDRALRRERRQRSRHRVGCESNLKQVETAEAAYYSQVRVVHDDSRNWWTRRLLREAPASSDYSFAVDLATETSRARRPVRHSDMTLTSLGGRVRARRGAVTPRRTRTDRGGAGCRRHRPRRGRRSAPRRGTASG